MPADTSNRTLVLSVVAVDLVGYSRKSVAEQMSLKEHFNQVLLQAISDISIADRIILDTGDGVAMGFLGDPEDALYVAMFMHDAINRDSAGSASGGVENNAIRIGINLGPVKLATGVGGHPNIIGDGINVAERIMGFAEPGQLTASRPLFEVMSRMSDHYATLFQYVGVRTDKQVRAHDVYLVGKSAAAYRQAERGVAERAAARAGQPIITPAIAAAVSRVALMPVQAAAKGMPPSPAAAGKRVSEAPPFAGKTAPPAPAKPAGAPSTPPAIGPGERNRQLIDFLEDRNKVAISAFMLAIIAVTLVALLAYRKMRVVAPEGSVPVVAALSPASNDNSVSLIPPPPAATAEPAPAARKSAEPARPDTTVATTPAPAVAARSAGTTVVPKVETKPSPATATALTATPSVAAPVAKPITAPVAPPASAVPAKGSERPPLPKEAGAPVPDAVRDKPKDTRSEKTERVDRMDRVPVRDDVRNEPRKPAPPRTPAERDKSPATTSAPIVPTYQSPAEAPRPETVAPTQKVAPPAVPVADIRVIPVSRSDPPYPVEGIRQGISSGVVRARIIIDANGNVSDVVILESRPISAFGRETRLTAKQWKYNPGAPGRIHEVEITFKP